MSDANYTLQEYVNDVRSILKQESDPEVFTRSIKPLSQKLAQCKTRPIGSAMKPKVLVQPGRGTPPHNHKTWAVVTSVEGEELETYFKRNDDSNNDGFAELEKTGDMTMRPGDVSICMPEEIHSVWNNTETVSVSLHTYGKHLNFTGRSSFDVEASKEIPYLVTVEA